MSEVRLIDANKLITELWQALWKYEDKSEKQFLESDELDVGDWFSHRTFVQDMSDIDRDVVQKQPTVDAVPVGFIEALHTYYVRRSKALQGRTGHMYTLYALALEKLVQSFNYVNAMDDEMKTERNCADGERR